ncbi:MAG: ABC transporter permease [Bifidobacteriaceae bacterium]|nr:ABC transporter permease [Bifidobacteriaceae bacterium]
MREAGAYAASRRITSVLIVILAGMVCVLGALTAGRTVAARAEMRSTLESAGSRVLEIRSMAGPGLFPSTVVDVVSALSGVDMVLALGTATDVHSGHRGAPPTVACWRAYGDVDRAVTLLSGRMPGPGEAIVSKPAMETLGMDGPAGYVADRTGEYPIVGVFTAPEPFSEFEAGAIVRIANPGETAARLVVTATDHTQVRWVESQTMRVVAPPDRSQVQVVSPASAAELQEQVVSGFGAYANQVFALVLILGMAMTTAVVFVDVTMARSDLGRRRALGATRGDIATLVITRTAIPTAIGAIGGTAVITALAMTGTATDLPGPDFTVAVAILCLLAAALAAAPPALIAAHRDPVKALRTP